jgi:hypothetical protein
MLVAGNLAERLESIFHHQPHGQPGISLHPTIDRRSERRFQDHTTMRDFQPQVERHCRAERLAFQHDLVGRDMQLIGQVAVRGPRVEIDAALVGAASATAIAAVVVDEHGNIQPPLPKLNLVPAMCQVPAVAVREQHHRSRRFDGAVPGVQLHTVVRREMSILDPPGRQSSVGRDLWEKDQIFFEPHGQSHDRQIGNGRFRQFSRHPTQPPRASETPWQRHERLFAAPS